MDKLDDVVVAANLWASRFASELTTRFGLAEAPPATEQGSRETKSVGNAVLALENKPVLNVELGHFVDPAEVRHSGSSGSVNVFTLGDPLFSFDANWGISSVRRGLSFEVPDGKVSVKVSQRLLQANGVNVSLNESFNVKGNLNAVGLSLGAGVAVGDKSYNVASVGIGLADLDADGSVKVSGQLMMLNGYVKAKPDRGFYNIGSQLERLITDLYRVDDGVTFMSY